MLVFDSKAEMFPHHYSPIPDEIEIKGEKNSPVLSRMSDLRTRSLKLPRQNIANNKQLSVTLNIDLKEVNEKIKRCVAKILMLTSTKKDESTKRQSLNKAEFLADDHIVDYSFFDHLNTFAKLFLRFFKEKSTNLQADKKELSQREMLWAYNIYEDHHDEQYINQRLDLCNVLKCEDNELPIFIPQVYTDSGLVLNEGTNVRSLNQPSYFLEDKEILFGNSKEQKAVKVKTQTSTIQKIINWIKNLFKNPQEQKHIEKVRTREDIAREIIYRINSIEHFIQESFNTQNNQYLNNEEKNELVKIIQFMHTQNSNIYANRKLNHCFTDDVMINKTIYSLVFDLNASLPFKVTMKFSENQPMILFKYEQKNTNISYTLPGKGNITMPAGTCDYTYEFALRLKDKSEQNQNSDSLKYWELIDIKSEITNKRISEDFLDPEKIKEIRAANS